MSRQLPEKFEVKIEGFAGDGSGLGLYRGRRVKVFGVFPGETVWVRPYKRSPREIKASVLAVSEASRDRIEAKEDHYLSCGPWQSVPYRVQCDWKKNNSYNVFKQAGIKGLIKPGLTPAQAIFGYRNKMEYTLVGDSDGEASLAFHKRGRHHEFFLFKSCRLAHPRLSEAAVRVIDILKEKKIKPNTVKSLIVRYSYYEDTSLVALYVTDRAFIKLDLAGGPIKGAQIIYSDPKSPASVETERLYSQGDDSLIEKIGDTELAYAFNNFFQINPPVFSDLLDFLKTKLPEGGAMLDLYCGVGTIGLCLRSKYKRVIGIEEDETAIGQAKANARGNNMDDSLFSAAKSEKVLSVIAGAKANLLVVDPPRNGLHPKVAEEIASNGPRYLAYVSCNPTTQARDLRLIGGSYEILDWELFDLYPQTPHVESVVILRKKRSWLEMIITLTRLKIKR